MGLSEYSLDEYTKQLRRQNEGGVCEHCDSALGHFNVCPLLTGARIEAPHDKTGHKFYRPERFDNIEQVKAHVTLRTPELELTAEDERFLRDINEAFS